MLTTFLYHKYSVELVTAKFKFIYNIFILCKRTILQCYMDREALSEGTEYKKLSYLVTDFQYFIDPCLIHIKGITYI